MKKLKIFILVIGILLIFLSFLLNGYNVLKLVILAFGILLFTLSIVFSSYKSVFIIFFVPIILIILTYGIDMFLFYKYNKIPIYVIEEKSNNLISVYQSFMYRIYNCNNELILDYGYEKDFICNSDLLNTIKINDFFNDLKLIKNKYFNKFVKLEGKISKISGVEYIELAMFTNNKNSLNGYVNFNDNYKVRVLVNEDLSKYNIYDNLVVIGRVSKIEEKNETFVIYLDDSKLITSEIYDSFTYEIVENNAKTLNAIADLDDYYFYGLSYLNIKYSDDAIYEISYLLLDNKINLDDIISDNSASILRDEESIVVAKKYDLEKFNLLVCESGKKIFANKDFNLSVDLCY